MIWDRAKNLVVLEKVCFTMILRNKFLEREINCPDSFKNRSFTETTPLENHSLKNTGLPSTKISLLLNKKVSLS